MRKLPATTTLTLLALLTGLAVFVSAPSTAAAATPCWKRVINQWLENKPIATTYPASCYQQALKHVPEDLRDYSDLPDAINAALQASLRGAKDDGTGSGSGGSKSPDKNPANPENKVRLPQGAPSRGLYGQAIDNLGTTKADSLPIPLLVLAGLGTALLLAAGALAAHKRLRARPRPPAAP
jgi:hypothetical protein